MNLTFITSTQHIFSFGIITLLILLSKKLYHNGQQPKQQEAAELARKRAAVAKAKTKADKLVAKSRLSRQKQINERVWKQELKRAKATVSTAAQVTEWQSEVAKSASAAKKKEEARKQAAESESDTMEKRNTRTRRRRREPQLPQLWFLRRTCMLT